MSAIAQTILEQLGGRRFAVMTGARDLVAIENGLQLRIGRGAKNGINMMRVTLTPADLYDVEFLRVRGLEVKKIDADEAIYAEDLQDSFTRATGFYTSL